MIIAFETDLSPVASEGELTTLPLTTIVVEPPPSRLTPFQTPSVSIKFASSSSVTPTLDACLPSTVIK